MKKKAFIYIGLTVLSWSYFGIMNSTGQTMPRGKPNIILIMTDDQSPFPFETATVNQARPFGFNGDSHVYTPNIDKLANDGLVFTQAYVSTSVCSASRYTTLTGRYAGRCEGVSFLQQFPKGQFARVENNTELEETQENLPRLLQNAGYLTGFVGKSHVIDHYLLDASTKGDYGFIKIAQNADPNVPEVSAAMAFNHEYWVKRIKEFGFDYVNAVYAANLKELNNDSLNVHNVEYKNKAALEFIDQCGSEPFFLYYSENVPHGPAPWVKSGGKYTKGLDANPKFTSKGYVDADYSYLPSREEIKQDVVAHGKDLNHAWLRWFDHAVGAVVDKLKEKGIHENTVIIITSDHGQYNHGKATNYEGGVKIPLMVYWPAGIASGSTYNELVQNIDFAPTFLDLAGIDPSGKTTLDGVSLKNVLLGSEKTPVHDCLFYEIGFTRAVRTKNWKYIAVRYDDATNAKIARGEKFNGFNGELLDLPYYIKNAHLGYYAAKNNPHYFEGDQLYDMVNDPMESTNLFDSKQNEVIALKQKLTGLLQSFSERPYAEFSDGKTIASGLTNLKEDWRTKDVLKVFPNPTKSTFYIELPESNELLLYTIYSSEGVVIEKGKLEDCISSIHLNGISRGSYILRITSGTRNLIHQLLLN